MKVHPRNQGTSNLDLALLVMMPAVILALSALVVLVVIQG